MKLKIFGWITWYHHNGLYNRKDRQSNNLIYLNTKQQSIYK